MVMANILRDNADVVNLNNQLNEYKDSVIRKAMTILVLLNKNKHMSCRYFANFRVLIVGSVTRMQMLCII